MKNKGIMCKINLMEMLHGFDPVFNENSKILILGSFPSVLSRETSFYYGNPRNRFWKLIAKIANDIEPIANEDKKAFLLRHNIALWDILMECEIKGSADSSIKGYEVADLGIVLSKAKIEKIFLNGKKSYEVFCKNYPELIYMSNYLPSTSPANVSFDENIWLEYLKGLI